MAIGFFDYDLILKPSKILFNLEAMKIANYFQNKKEVISLEPDLKKIDNFDKFYVCRNITSNLTPKRKTIDYYSKENVIHIGLAYSNGIYIPMDQYLEEQDPFIPLYNSYLREKILANKLTMLQAEKILNSHFIRLRAGTFELDLSKLKRKEKLYIYDFEIEKVTDWENKLKFARQELMNSNKQLKATVVNGFKFTSFDSVKKLTNILGFKSSDVHLFSSDTYKKFVEGFDSIASWVSSRSGIKYYFGQDINPINNSEVVRNLCLSINKYLYTKSIGKACEFIVDSNCEISPINKLQKDFQYWTTIRVGDKTLKEYFIERNKLSYNEYYNIIKTTPYKSLFDSLCNKTKNNIKQTGWYYHV